MTDSLPPDVPGTVPTRRPVEPVISYRKMEARLIWRDANGAHDITISKPTTLGSSKLAGILIHDPTVSRYHLDVIPGETAVVIRDKGSKNGTYLCGARIPQAELPDGARVQIGNTEVQIHRVRAEAETRLWAWAEYGQMLGRSVPMREMFALISRLAQSDASVFIHGESGTGKELIAKALHLDSPRAKYPFAVVDCGIVNEQLLESELFGHVRGAFTGAVRDREGAIAEADGGTVFLDEIGEMSLAVQPKFLRLLEEGSYKRLGDTKRRKVNVRFVSASHRDLQAMVNEGTFREDLYFRIAALVIEVPPLRDRGDDMFMLLDHFLPPAERPRLAEPAVQRAIRARAWKGNVRELRNFASRAALMGVDAALAGVAGPRAAADAMAASAGGLDAGAGIAFPPELFAGEFGLARDRVASEFKMAYARAVLERHNGKVKSAAEEAGVSTNHIYKMLRGE